MWVVPSVRSVYDEQLPEVLQQLVAEFGKFMKQQREVGDEINRHNDGVIKKVRQDIDTHCQVWVMGYTHVLVHTYT